MSSVTKIIVPRLVIDDDEHICESCEKIKDMLYRVLPYNEYESLNLSDNIDDDELFESIYNFLNDSEKFVITQEDGCTIIFSQEEIDTDVFEKYIKENNIIIDETSEIKI